MLSANFKIFCCATFLAATITQSCQFLKQALGLSAIPPRVQVRSLIFHKMDHKSLSLELGFEVQNQNHFDVEFSNLEYNLFAGNVKVAEGVYAHKIIIREVDLLYIELPVNIFLSEIFSLVKDLNDLKNLKFRVQGKVTMITELGSIKINFDRFIDRPIKFSP